MFCWTASLSSRQNLPQVHEKAHDDHLYQRPKHQNGKTGAVTVTNTAPQTGYFTSIQVFEDAVFSVFTELDAYGSMVRPEVYTTYDFPCSEQFAATAQALASDAQLMYTTVTADYASRWPDITPPTEEECQKFCEAVQITVK